MPTPSLKLPGNGIPRNPLGLEPDYMLGSGVRVGDNFRSRFVPYSVLQQFQIRTTSQVPGVIRRFWRAVGRYTGPPKTFSWTADDFDDSSPRPGGPSTTRLNYLIESPETAVLHGGNQLSRPLARTGLTPSVAAAKPRQITGGNQRNRPVLRVRVPSYGSRVPALNSAPPGSQG